ncbi:acyl-CoA carboxylase epsilon subunit [Cellulomonas sp. NS3]|uniref:acyl-CoA carboxylase epsilon subunit n=1 Tax=Cellulomonas sp. NS3 TaxID=2973977 RepID=UPI00216115F3|nr:acyl-CoA carboxylase epsilon subunit [Cellulomonas sp. NS3]
MTDAPSPGGASPADARPDARPDPAPAARPHVRVVRGAPDDVELAALVAGLVAAASEADTTETAPRSAWTDRARVLRGSVAPGAGPDAWRWSLRG